MRKLKAAVFISLDGIMQAPGGPDEDRSRGFRFGGWSFPFNEPSSGGEMNRLLIEPEYDLLLGKRTYDIFANYWPNHQEGPIGAKFQRINKYVFTHSDEPLDWENSSRLSGDTAEAVRTLKQTDGRDLLIQGSSSLYPALLEARLIDRLLMMIHPVLLGRGKSIFDGCQGAAELKLARHFVSDSGVIFAYYEPVGDVRVGSFADVPEDQKTPLEQA
jgi:dihydrofolate reductase